MYTSSLVVLGAFASSAIAQALTYSNTSFTAPVMVGSVFPISFSRGNGEPVSIGFGNSTYAFQIVDGLTAPGRYDWDVAVPVNVINGTYQLALLQGDADPVFSPTFTFAVPPEEEDDTTDAPETTIPFPGAGATATTTTTTTVTAIYLPYPSNMTMPTITYIYWEESCGCHQTSTCAESEVPKSLSTTTVTYLESACGCTTTVEAPCAETVIPVAPAPATAAPAPATNTPVAPTVAPAAPVAPTQTQSTLPAYTGAASRLAGSSLSFLAVAFAMVLA